MSRPRLRPSRRRPPVLQSDLRLEVDGKAVTATSGQSLLGVLVAERVWTQRRHPVTGRFDAGICGMGVCQACEVFVDGQGTVRACGLEVVDGMRVRTGVVAWEPR